MTFLQRSSRAIRNRVLSGLDPPDFEHVRPFLRSVPLKSRSVLQEAGAPCEFVHFVETGIVSLLVLANGNVVETAMVGSYGFSPVAIVLGAKTSTLQSRVLVPGSALRISAKDLQHVMSQRPQIREHLLRYVQSLIIHTCQTALCGTHHALDQRLASWLSLACDALGSDIIRITHDQLATILGLRRAGVTEALSRFEDDGRIRKSRGELRVLNRERLRLNSCRCYEIITSTYTAADIGTKNKEFMAGQQSEVTARSGEEPSRSGICFREDVGGGLHDTSFPR